MNYNILKRITFFLCVVAIPCFSPDLLKAQTKPLDPAFNHSGVESQEIRRTNDKLNLSADKVNITHELAVFDSLLLKMRMEEEAFAYPADDIYGSWPLEYVKAYSDLVLPDSFRIDVSSFVIPAEGKITSKYGMRKKRFHYGTDLKVKTGDTIRAAFDGKVRVRKYERKGYGYYLVLRHHNGLETVYGHLSKYLVVQDQVVKAGEPIGLGGNTGRSSGSHLHFECRFMGQPINPEQIVDFANYCTYDDVYVYKKKTSGKVTTSLASAGGGGVQYHRVKSGDTLSGIAKKYKVSVRELCRLNGIKDTSILSIGQAIRYS